MKTKRPWAITALLGAALLGVLLIAMGAGSVYIPPGEVARILTDPSQEGSFATIIRQIRLPRVILAALVGSCLATAGAVFQGLFKNPMADPYVIGVSSGASLGAVVAMALGLQLRFLGLDSVPILAFLGAVATMLLVYNLARTGGKVPVLTLLVAGVAVGSFLSALVSLFVYFADERLHQVDRAAGEQHLRLQPRRVRRHPALLEPGGQRRPAPTQPRHMRQRPGQRRVALR